MPKVTDPNILAALNGTPPKAAAPIAPAPQQRMGVYEQAIRSPEFAKDLPKKASAAETDIQKAARLGVLNADELRSSAKALRTILPQTATGPGARVYPGHWNNKDWTNLDTIDQIGSLQLFSSGRLEKMKGGLSDADRNWLRGIGPSSSKSGNYNLDAAKAMEWAANRSEAYNSEKIKWERKYGSIQIANENGQSFDTLFNQWAAQKYPRPVLSTAKPVQQGRFTIVSVQDVPK